MAEGWARKLHGDQFEFHSAGLAPHGLDPRAVAAMGEAGVDISGHRSKHVNDLRPKEFDLVVTVCGHADENCPVFPGRTRVVHHGFEDPPRLARDASDEESAMIHYRRVRDEIRAWIERFPELMDE